MRFLLLVLIGSVVLFSCRTQQRAVYNYLEDFTDTTVKKNVFTKEPAIQNNDLLQIQIYSASTEASIDALYNLSQGATQNGAYGFLVDQQGNIEYPRIGTIHAEGLTKSELAEVLKSKLSTQLSNPSIIIRFLNFRIMVMGEVGNPGVLNLPTEQLTILEAIGMAGDITEFGKKKEIKILRQNNGQRELGIIDVTSEKMFESRYFQLQQNDIVLVEQTRYKLRQTEQQRISQQLGFALSIITSVALLYNIFRAN